MSDVQKYIDKKEAEWPGFRQEVENETKNLLISEKIRMMRLEAGMTQDELAKKMKTTKSAISRLENNFSSMKIETIEKVAKVFNKKLSISFT